MKFFNQALSEAASLPTNLRLPNWPGYVLVAFTISSFISFVGVLVLSHILNQEEFGMYRFALSWFPLMGLFTMIGSHTTINRHTGGDVYAYMRYIYIRRLKLGLVGSLFFVCIAASNYILGSVYLSYMFLVLAFHTIFPATLDILFGYYYAHAKYRELCVVQSIAALIPISTSVYISYLFESPLLTLISLTVSTICIYLVFWAHIHLIEKKRGILTLSKDKIKNEAKEPYHITLSTTLEMSSTLVDKIIVYYFLGSGMFAIYTFVVIFIDQFRWILQNLGKVFFRNLAEKSVAAKEKYLHTIYKDTGMWVVIMITGWFIIAPIIFTYIFPLYKEAHMYSLVYAFSLINILSYIKTISLWENVSHKDAYINQSFSLAAIATCTSIGAYTNGLLGAVLGVTFAHLLSTLFALKRKNA